MLLEAKTVTFDQKGDNAKHYRVRAVVVHCEEYRFGVEFINLKAEARQAIQLLLNA